MACIGRKFFGLDRRKPVEQDKKRWNGLTPGVALQGKNLKPELQQLSSARLELLEILFVPSHYKKVRGLSSDLANDEAFLDFFESGISQGFSPSPFFDADHYSRKVKKMQQIEVDRTEAAWDWVVRGIDHRIVPTPFFDEQFYLDANEDVSSTQGWGFEHYLLNGLFENRAPNDWFHPNWYAKTYLAGNQFLKPAYHYALLGISRNSYPSSHFEGLFRKTIVLEKADALLKLQTISILMNLCQDLVPEHAETTASLLAVMFVPEYYRLISNSGEQMNNVELFHDFLINGIYKDISPSPLFDSSYYAEQSQTHTLGDGVKPSSMFLDWLVNGYTKRILPTLLFDEDYYLTVNADLKGARMWGFEHFIRHGCFEKRDPHPNFSSRWYLGEYGPLNVNLPVYYYYLTEGFRKGDSPCMDFSNLTAIQSSDAE